MSRSATAGATQAGLGGLVSAAVARAEAWLLEPAPAVPAAAPAGTATRPTVLVAGAAPCCGATTIARGLAAELARRDAARACAVVGADARGALPLGTSAAARLARAVERREGLAARASGRLCLIDAADLAAAQRAVRGLAALVVDGGVGSPGAAAAVADASFVVAGPRVEPALAELVAAALARVGPEPAIVLNRAAEPSGSWEGRADALVPESPAGARLALSGRGAGGAFGEAVAELADRCEAR